MKIRSTSVGGDTFLSQIINLVEDALGRKPPLQRLVDKFAGYFAFMSIIVAVSTFFFWFYTHGFSPALIALAIIPVVAKLCFTLIFFRMLDQPMPANIAMANANKPRTLKI